jgi:ketosteroid isomerase-like protein
MRGSAIDGRAEIAEIQLLGDWAWIRNRITVSVTPPGGGAVSRAGYTLTILRKGADGRWRLFRDANLVS